MYNNLHHQPMSVEELDELIARVREGDDYAMKYVVSNNIKLILKFIGGCSEWHVELLHDIVPFIMRAVEKYDSTKGCFSGYMRGAVKWGRWRRYDRLKLEKERAEIVRQEATNTRLYYRPSPSPEELFMRKEYRAVRSKALAEAIDSLDIRQRWMIQQYYYKGKTLREIADEDGVTHQRVGQILDRAEKMMRPYVEQYKQDLR